MTMATELNSLLDYLNDVNENNTNVIKDTSNNSDEDIETNISNVSDNYENNTDVKVNVDFDSLDQKLEKWEELVESGSHWTIHTAIKLCEYLFEKNMKYFTDFYSGYEYIHAVYEDIHNFINQYKVKYHSLRDASYLTARELCEEFPFKSEYTARMLDLIYKFSYSNEVFNSACNVYGLPESLYNVLVCIYDSEKFKGFNCHNMYDAYNHYYDFDRIIGFKKIEPYDIQIPYNVSNDLDDAKKEFIINFYKTVESKMDECREFFEKYFKDLASCIHSMSLSELFSLMEFRFYNFEQNTDYTHFGENHYYRNVQSEPHCYVDDNIQFVEKMLESFRFNTKDMIVRMARLEMADRIKIAATTHGFLSDIAASLLYDPHFRKDCSVDVIRMKLYAYNYIMYNLDNLPDDIDKEKFVEKREADICVHLVDILPDLKSYYDSIYTGFAKKYSSNKRPHYFTDQTESFRSKFKLGDFINPDEFIKDYLIANKRVVEHK